MLVFFVMTVIINELLCYMLCKIDSVPLDVLNKLVGENFSDDEVECAKSLLCDFVEESIRAGNRRGQNKKKMNLDGIAKMLIECDRTQLPKFVALDLAKLPPITVDCIDVSALMRKQQLMDVELSNMKDMIQDILKVTADTSRRVEEAAASKAVSSVQSPGGVTGSENRLSYADVVQEASGQRDGGAWTVANRAKRGKPPAVRPASKPLVLSPASEPGAAAPSVPHVTSVKTSQASKPHFVVGAKITNGPIRAVPTVRRCSLFMSRLPPGTGEDVISSYVREQTGAESVTALKLPTRYDSYESYRLDIINPPAEVNLLDPLLWAQGLFVRRFFQKRKTTGSISEMSQNDPA